METQNVTRINGHQETASPAPYSKKMEAIASGVRARFEESTSCSRKLIDETITIARALGVSPAEIERWAERRRISLAEDSARFKEIKTLLNQTRVIGMTQAAKRTHRQ